VADFGRADQARNFPKGWWGCDLGSYRPCESTYQLYPYDSLPAPEESLFHGEFQWLIGTGDEPLPPADPAPLQALQQAGLVLPQSFVDFMHSPELQRRVPSCTACEWDLSGPIPSPLGDGAHLVRFLRDQQDVLFWYLYLRLDTSPAESAAVVCSPIAFDQHDLSQRRDEVLANTWWCAPDFEHFVYRFWIENVLWFTLNEAGERDATQEAYLSHYAG